MRAVSVSVLALAIGHRRFHILALRVCSALKHLSRGPRHGHARRGSSTGIARLRATIIGMGVPDGLVNQLAIQAGQLIRADNKEFTRLWNDNFILFAL